MNKQESNTSFHLKGESTKTGKLPVSEQYLEDKEIQDQTEQLKNQTDISTEGLTETAILVRSKLLQISQVVSPVPLTASAPPTTRQFGNSRHL